MKQSTVKKAVSSVTLSLALCAAALPCLPAQASTTISSYPYSYFSDLEMDYYAEADYGYVDEGNSTISYTSAGEIWGLDVTYRYLEESCIDFTMPTTIDGTPITEFTAYRWQDVYFSGYNDPEFSISELNFYFPANYDKVELDGIYYAAQAIIDGKDVKTVELNVYVNNPDAVITSTNNWAYIEIADYINKIHFVLHTDNQLYINNGFYITDNVIPITASTPEPEPTSTPTPAPTEAPTPTIYPLTCFADSELDYTLEADNGYIDENNSYAYYSSNGELWGLDITCRHLYHSCIDFTMPTTIDGTTITEFTPKDAGDVHFYSDDNPEYSISELNIIFPANYEKVELDSIYYLARTIIDSGDVDSVNINVYVENPNAVITSSNSWTYSDVMNYVNQIDYVLHTDNSFYVEHPFFITNSVVALSK